MFTRKQANPYSISTEELIVFTTFSSQNNFLVNGLNQFPEQPVKLLVNSLLKCKTQKSDARLSAFNPQTGSLEF